MGDLANIRAFMKKYPERVNEITRKIAFDTFNRITEAVPVDTGRARMSFQLTLGNARPVTVEIPPAPKGVSGSGLPSYGKSSPVTAGLAAIGIITNNLPYIIPLNEGHSKSQAPQGKFIEKSIAEALSIGSVL